MTLTTHAIVGTAVGSIFWNNPLLAVVTAFASHFILDAIPHVDYPWRSLHKDLKNPLNNDLKIGKLFFLDLARISFDGVLGLMLVVIIFYNQGVSLWLAGILAIASMLPDALQFVYIKTKLFPLGILQSFHIKIMHCKAGFLDNNIFRGYVWELFLVVIVVIISRIIL